MPDVREYSLAALHYRPARCVILRVLTSTQYSLYSNSDLVVHGKSCARPATKRFRLSDWRPLEVCCRHSYAVERGLVVGVSGQPHYCYRPYYLTAKFRSPSSYVDVVSDKPFPDMSCRASLHKWGLAQSPSFDCDQQQTMIRIVDTFPLTKFEGGLNLLHAADDDAVIWLESTATAALAK